MSENSVDLVPVKNSLTDSPTPAKKPFSLLSFLSLSSLFIKS